jgi:hypothetical protein
VTPADIIVEVRKLVQDTRAPYRYSDGYLLGHVNQVLRRMAMIRPDLFALVTDITVVSVDTTQTLPADAIRFVDVHAVDGRAVVEVSRDMMDRSAPTWRSASPAQPVNYMRHVRNPTLFFLYPPPPVGATVTVEYAQAPSTYALASTITAPKDVYSPVIIDGVVAMVMAADDEYATSGQADAALKNFFEGLKLGLEARELSDSASALSRTEAV